MKKTKGELLEHYAGKDPTAFYQFDGFAGVHGDDVLRPDDDGDSIMGGGTYELMTGAYAVRVLVTRGTPEAVAVRLLKKIRKSIKRNPLVWLEAEPADRDPVARPARAGGEIVF